VKEINDGTAIQNLSSLFTLQCYPLLGYFLDRRPNLLDRFWIAVPSLISFTFLPRTHQKRSTEHERRSWTRFRFRDRVDGLQEVRCSVILSWATFSTAAQTCWTGFGSLCRH
jgi:hypothetical protein